MPQSDKRIRVAIMLSAIPVNQIRALGLTFFFFHSGGGIGGLSLAAALRHLADKDKLDIHIYEAAPALTEIGAGINFWPRSWRVMKEIGVQSALSELLSSTPPDEMASVFKIRKADQSEGTDIDDIMMKGGGARFHRVELLKVLHEHAAGQIHYSHRLESFEEVGNQVIVHFVNGTSATCDFLVGADGIRSTVRKSLLEKRGLPFHPRSYEPYWSGSYVYRGLIPVEELERVYPGHPSCRLPMMFIGKFRHIVTYLVSHNQLVNVVAIHSDYSRESDTTDGPTAIGVPQEEALAAFTGWEPPVQALLNCVKNPMRYALQAIQPLDTYSMNRVVLLGDSAHAMLPHQGAGAGTALDDAYILANLLSSPQCRKSTIPNIAKVYDAIRRPAANNVCYLSALAGRLCQISSPGFEDVQSFMPIHQGDDDDDSLIVIDKDADDASARATVDMGRLQNLVRTISKNWEWSWAECAEDDKRRALEMLAADTVNANVDAVNGTLELKEQPPLPNLPFSKNSITTNISIFYLALFACASVLAYHFP